MGTWDTGAFDNDHAADWAGDFDEAEPVNREEVVWEALRAVAPDRYVEMDIASAAIAAAATVAALVRGDNQIGGPYGPESLSEAGFEPRAELRAAAVATLRRVLGEQSEWVELWDETDQAAQARAEINTLIRILQPTGD